MSRSQIAPPTSDHATSKLVLILKNSKYTYDQFRIFHQTIIGMLENADLTSLHPEQQKNLCFFINMLISLLDTPTARILNRTYHSARRGTCNKQQDQIQLTHSDTDFQLLLYWIGLVVKRNEITIETLLHEFFVLELNTPYN